MPKTYTAAGSATAGGVYTASAHNVIVTNVNNFIVPCAVRALRTTSQTIATATTVAIQFNAADAFDTDAMHDTVTNNTRITVNTPGIYVFNATAFLAAANSTGLYRLLGIRKNGSTELAYNNAAVNTDARVAVSVIDEATTVGDYYEAVIYQDSGANVTFNTLGGITASFAAAWIGRTS